MGGGLLPRVTAFDHDGREVVRGRTASQRLDAEDAEVAAEAGWGGSGVALGGGIAKPAEAQGEAAEGIPDSVPLLADAAPAHALHRVQASGGANRQWGDGGGVQDSVHAKTEVVGDALEEARGADDSHSPRDPA